MIYDTLSHYQNYLGLLPGLDRALTFLMETDFSSLPDGRYPLDGRVVFASLDTYKTRQENDTPEAHRQYIDVQYLISGRESVGIAPLEDMTEEASADPEHDIWFYRGPTQPLLLGDGRFMILFPTDAHAPCVALEEPELVRKAVVKVRVDELCS